MKQIIFLLFLANIAFSQNPKHVVKAVHDGDSYRIETTEWIRVEDTLLEKVIRMDQIRIEGVDCPEIIWPGHISATQPFGREVGDSVRAIVKGKTVMLETHGKDRYGRTLAKVILPDGQDLALIILSRGWGVYLRNDLKLSDRRKYQRARDKAKKAGIVIWSDPNRIDPAEWRKTHR